MRRTEDLFRIRAALVAFEAARETPLEGPLIEGLAHIWAVFVSPSHWGTGTAPRISPIAGLLALIGVVVWIWFTVLYVARNGQTIAKKWLGIKVVRSDGSKASLGRIFWLRNVVNALVGIIPFYFLIDHLVIFSDSRQCVHDKIADTIVVVA